MHSSDSDAPCRVSGALEALTRHLEAWSDLEAAVLECHRVRWDAGAAELTDYYAGPEDSAEAAVAELRQEIERCVDVWLANWGHSYPVGREGEPSVAVCHAARRLSATLQTSH